MKTRSHGRRAQKFGGSIDDQTVIDEVPASAFRWDYFKATIASINNAQFLAGSEVTKEMADAEPDMLIQLRPSNAGYEAKFLPRRCPQCGSVFQVGNIRQKFCWRCTKLGDTPDSGAADQLVLREVRAMLDWLKATADELGSRLTDAPDMEQMIDIPGFGQLRMTPRYKLCAEYIGAGCQPPVAAYASGIPTDDILACMRGQGRCKGFLKAVSYYERVHNYLKVSSQIRAIDDDLLAAKSIDKEGNRIDMPTSERVKLYSARAELVALQTKLLPPPDPELLAHTASIEDYLGRSANTKDFVDAAVNFTFRVNQGRKSPVRVPASTSGVQ